MMEKPFKELWKGWKILPKGDSPVDFFPWFHLISKMRISCLNYDHFYVTKGDHLLSLSIPQWSIVYKYHEGPTFFALWIKEVEIERAQQKSAS